MIEYGKVYTTDPEALDKFVEETKRRQESSNYYFDYILMPAMQFSRLLVENAGRPLREKLKLRTKRKIKSCTISFRKGMFDQSHDCMAQALTREQFYYQKAQCAFFDTLKEELNIGKIIFEEEPWPQLEIEPKINFKMLGPQLGKDMKQFQALLKAMSQQELLEQKSELEKKGYLVFFGVDISSDQIEFVSKKQEEKENVVYLDQNVKFSYDTEITQDVISSTFLREATAAISQTRKNKGYSYFDKLYISIKTKDEQFYREIINQKILIDKETNSNIICELMTDSYDDSKLNEFADLGSGLITKFSVTILEQGEKQ